jgi:hypothetical protein
VDPVHLPNTPEFLKGVPILKYLYLLCDLTEGDIFVKLWVYYVLDGEFSAFDNTISGRWELFEKADYHLRYSNVCDMISNNKFYINIFFNIKKRY